MRAQLIPLDGHPAIEIQKDLVLVGRKEDCDLRLEHKSDLGSTNGTRVNGQRVRRAALLPNDQLSIASCKFRVYLGPDEAPLPIRHEERTQNLDASEVAGLLRQPRMQDLADSSDELPALPLRPNVLPDVYPDDEQDKAKP
jgi:hypothetical protein